MQRLIFALFFGVILSFVACFLPSPVLADQLCISAGGLCMSPTCASGWTHHSIRDYDCAVPVAVTRICCIDPCHSQSGSAGGICRDSAALCPSGSTPSSLECAYGRQCCQYSSGSTTSCNPGTNNNSAGCLCGDVIGGSGFTGCTSGSCTLAVTSGNWRNYNFGYTFYTFVRNHFEGGVPMPSGYDRFGVVFTAGGTGLGTNYLYYATSSWPGGSRQFIITEGAGNYNGVCGGGAPPPPPRYDINGYVWIDNNRDGSKQSTEPYWTGSLNVHLGGAASANTNTNVGTAGPYSFFNYLAGNYTVSITPPADHVATTPTSRGVTLGPDRYNINFGIVPIYSIRGSIFNDVDRDYYRDAGESKTWSQAATFTKSAGGTLTVDSSAGTFAITGLYAGLYNVNYTGGIPSGFINRHPENGIPPFFSVRVGSGCTYSPLHPNPASRAVCDGRGDVANLWFVITDSIPWYQSYGLDIRMDNGVDNRVPAAPVYPPYSSAIDNN